MATIMELYTPALDGTLEESLRMGGAQEAGPVPSLVLEPADRARPALLCGLVCLVAGHAGAPAGVVDPQAFALA